MLRIEPPPRPPGFEAVTVILADPTFTRVVAVAQLWADPEHIGDPESMESMIGRVAADAYAAGAGPLDSKGGIVLGHPPIDLDELLAEMGEQYGVAKAAGKVGSVDVDVPPLPFPSFAFALVRAAEYRRQPGRRPPPSNN